ncbi:hypothetical protein [Ruegeria sp. HKCCA5014]|uniref:hypothetical protein n=1 Tax=Ruegeria sp. HKCCA5014 TaxID=2682980 RepID=UPI001489893F|nr:hypothetical protein [Ruegeria sp. HKCCA5014]
MITKRDLLLSAGAVAAAGSARAQSMTDLGVTTVPNTTSGETYQALVESFQRGIKENPNPYNLKMETLGGVQGAEGLAEFYIERFPMFDFDTIQMYDPNLSDLLGGNPNYFANNADGPSYTKGPDFDKEPYDKRDGYDKMGFNRTY